VFATLSLLVLPPEAFADPMVLAESFLVRLTVVNVGLAVFNLVPAFPMDGGRVLRALLAWRMPWARATRVAASLGQGLALLFGLVGLFMGHPILVFVALFVWMGAGAEAASAELETSLAGLRVRDAMIREFRSLDSSDTLDAPVAHILDGFQADFPVHADGRFRGLLTRDALVDGLSKLGPSALVGKVTRDTEDVDVGIGPDVDLVKALSSMDARRLSTAVVLEGGHVVGLLTRENVAEVVLLRQALRDLPNSDADLASRATPAWPHARTGS
jgi:predicted transcriptional regulator